MDDLSAYHDPVLEDFAAEEAGRSSPISAERSAFFREFGFVTGIPILSPRQVEILRADLKVLMAPGQAANPLFYEYNLNESSDPAKVLFHALGVWRVSPAFHDLLFLPGVVGAAETLLGGPVRFWHDQLFVKPARDGAVVEWHQDYSYWTRTKPVAHLTCWIGLDDAAEDNGCVRYVPASHRWPLLPRYPLSGRMDAIFEFLSEEQRAAFLPVPVVQPAGHASFHHPLTVHGSYANTTDRPRRAVVLNFVKDGVVSDSDDPLLAGVPPVPKGQPLGGRFFPLLSRTYS